MYLCILRDGLLNVLAVNLSYPTTIIVIKMYSKLLILSTLLKPLPPLEMLL